MSRKKQPFFWFPPWKSPSKQPKPLPIPSKLPPCSPPPSPQLDADRTQSSPSSPPLPSPSRSLTKVPSTTSSGREEVLPQAEPPTAHDDSEELVDEFDKSFSQEERAQKEIESEKVTETETSSMEPTISQITEEIKQGIDLEPQKDFEDQLEKIKKEEFQLDSEAEKLQQEKSPIQIDETKQIPEEFHSKEVETPKEEEVEARREEVSEEPKKVSQPKILIKVSDSMSPSKTTEEEEETPEESKNDALKESKRHISAKKERKITISTLPNSSSHNLEQPIMQKELKNEHSRLVQKLSIGHQFKAGNQKSVNIITLASENQGASMFIGYEIHPGKKLRIRNETKEETYNNVRGNQPIASINSNVQGINSSILEETNYSERNPGVHMNISTKPTVPVNCTRKTESQKATSSISSPQKLTYEPNIRRRCLRGLFLESSEDDMKNSQKPRRHGCRFTER